MTDLISRQAAIASAISGRIRTLPTSENGEKWIRTAEVRQSLLDVPSTEVEPVKHGRWKGKPIAGYSTVRCSVCGEVYTENNGRWLYCPNCGAKMDGIEE